MKWGGMILTALLFAALPATAGAIGPLPPVYSPPANVYAVGGSLSNYVPATMLSNGSITIRVTMASATAAYAKGQALTFAITPATRIAFDRSGQMRNGTAGQVRVTSALRISTLAALQALPAALVMVDRAPESADFGRTP